jgi:hypothetical protein
MLELKAIAEFDSYTEELPRPPLGAYLQANFVWIIEWLNAEDRNTGLELHSWIEARRPGCAKYRPCKTASDVFFAIDRVTEIASRHNQVPVLHLEAHGNELGISATGANGSSEQITWEAFTAHLQKLNVVTRCNLIWVVIACKGFAAVKALNCGPRAPVAILVGPDANMTPADAANASKEFYRNLFASNPRFTDAVENASREMIDVSLEPEPFALLTFETLVRTVILANRTGRALSPVALQERWNTMFMIDLYPENKIRYGLDVAALIEAIKTNPRTPSIRW